MGTKRGTSEMLLRLRSAGTFLVLLMAIGLIGYGCGQEGQKSAKNQKTQKAVQAQKTMQTFHDAHTKKAKLECTSCHKTMQAPGYLQREAGVLEVAPTNARVSLDRKVCFGCHQAGPKPWYGDKPLVAGEAYGKRGE